MREWRQYGPIGVLFDVIASICTPQTRQLLERFQREEAAAVGRDVHLMELVKPVKTRWNSYYDAFVRAARLHGPLDSYVEVKLDEYRIAAASAKRTRKASQAPEQKPRLFIREGGLSGRDWATITEYIKLLEPFAEATRLLEGRGRHGRHGAIWEVLITFEWLLDQLEALKERLKDIDYDDPEAPEDHLMLNVNLAHAKLAKYYAKFDDAPVYYAATVLHPHYKHHLEALWKVPDDYNSARDGPHYRDGWLTSNHRAFLAMWKDRKDAAVVAEGAVAARPFKKPRVGLSASRSAFLQSSMDAAMKQVEANLEDEYEVWRRQPTLDEDDPLALNPVQYWQLQAQQYPVLAKFAIDVLTVPAAATNCERTFSELGDMLGTQRLQMKPELIAALQCLKSWKRVGIKPSIGSTLSGIRALTTDDIAQIQEQFNQFDYS